MAFPIIGWAKLPKEQTRPDVFDSIARCGITVFMTCDDSTEDVLAQLDLAAEHGLQALVTDPRFTPTDDDDCVDRALEAAQEFANHPATFGFNICDEPGMADSSTLSVQPKPNSQFK